VGRRPDRSTAAAYEDCVTVAEWVHARLDDFGARRMVLAGDGAGGDLAFAAATHCRDKGIAVAAVLANGPAVDPTAGSLAGLPPVVLGIGAHDPLLEDTLHSVRRLREAHVPTRFRIFPTLGHAYGTEAPLSEAAGRAVEQLVRDLGQLLWDGTLG
jgi:acetyl esterase/lipase